MDPYQLSILHGRGTPSNPTNRFERLSVEADFDHLAPDDDHFDRLARPKTEYFVDSSRSIITTNDSPDVGFTHSINPYRGCSHGCCYCYARPTHEYLGFSAGLDFETKVMVKRDAPALLRNELLSPRYRPVHLAMSGVTDCYQPGERKFAVTRGCLEVLAEFRNPTSIITKNHLVTRDLDLLADLARSEAAVVMLSITTLDADLTRVMEPQTSIPTRRLEAVRRCAAAGVPVGVLIAPVIPGLNDHEMAAILAEAKSAGAGFAGFVPLRLPYAVAGIFEQWIRTHFPDRADKVLNRVRALRGGKLNDSQFGSRMTGQGIWADQLQSMFALGQRKSGLTGSFPKLSTEQFRRPGAQLGLW